MPLFKRFDELPLKDTTIETEIRDLKQEMAPDGQFTLAKDVAAFANHLGGCLIIGATEVEGRVGSYVGIPPAAAEKLETAFSLAVRDRCSPKPLHDCRRFSAETEGNVVLVVNVDPYIGGQPIGVAVKKGERDDLYKGDSYVFPMRVGKDCRYLLPEQLPMFSEPRIRRVVVQISAIPIGEEVKVYPVPFGGTRPPCHTGRLREINQNENYFLVDMYPTAGQVYTPPPPRPSVPTMTPRRYPLDLVKTVYRSPHWTIVVDECF